MKICFIFHEIKNTSHPWGLRSCNATSHPQINANCVHSHIRVCAHLHTFLFAPEELSSLRKETARPDPGKSPGDCVEWNEPSLHPTSKRSPLEGATVESKNEKTVSQCFRRWSSVPPGRRECSGDGRWRWLPNGADRFHGAELWTSQYSNIKCHGIYFMIIKAQKTNTCIQHDLQIHCKHMSKCDFLKLSAHVMKSTTEVWKVMRKCIRNL